MWVANYFLKKFKTQLDASLNKVQHKQELLCGKIFGSGRNVYIVEDMHKWLELISSKGGCPVREFY
jgi:hypothetical protein